MWKLLAIIILIGIVGSWYSSRRLRDPRLDRDWSDDEPAPYDAPADSSYFDTTDRLGSRRAYERMLDEPKPSDD